MAELRIEQPHGFSAEEAKKRLEALGKYFQNKHGIQVTWEGDRASFAGKYMVVSIKGAMSLAPGKVVFSGDDPGFLVRSKAKEYIARKLQAYLDPGKKVEELPTG